MFLHKNQPTSFFFYNLHHPSDFFKLRNKLGSAISFLGTSENAVMSQIWVAMIHYLLIAYLKFLHGFKLGMTELTNRIRDTLMQNQSLLEALKYSFINSFDGIMLLLRKALYICLSSCLKNDFFIFFCCFFYFFVLC